MRSLAVLLAFVAPATLLPAQVIPDNLHRRDGNTGQGANWRGPRRYQVLYGATILTTLRGPTVSVLRLRQDGAHASPARTFNLTARMSSVGVPVPEHASRTSFAANLGSDATVVLNARPVSLPAVQPVSGPPPFVVSLTLDRPFLVPPTQNLLVDLEFTPTDQADPNPWFLDAEAYDSLMWGLRVTPFGAGCPNTGEFRVYHYRTNLSEALTLNWASDASPNLVGWMTAGLDDQRIGPFPLPLDLGVIGAPGCRLYHDQLVYLAAQLSVYQSGSQLVAGLLLPRDYRLTGLRLFLQGMILDPAVNRLGLRVSGGVRLDFDTPPSPSVGLTLSGSPGYDQVGAVVENQVFVFELN